jgi:hypothetical protein
MCPSVEAFKQSYVTKERTEGKSDDFRFSNFKSYCCRGRGVDSRVDAQLIEKKGGFNDFLGRELPAEGSCFRRIMKYLANVLGLFVPT